MGILSPFLAGFLHFPKYFAPTFVEQHANEQRKMIKTSFDAQNLLRIRLVQRMVNF